MATTTTQKKRGRPSKSAQQKKLEQERELKKRQERHVVKSALLLIFGILMIALAFIKGESVWNIVHNVLFGVFGKMSYFLGFVLLLHHGIHIEAVSLIRRDPSGGGMGLHQISHFFQVRHLIPYGRGA